MQPVECPVCNSGSATPFFRREGVPVHQHLILRDPDAARNIMRGDLHLVVCNECGFVFNAAFDAARLNYNQAYDNTQSCSPCFEQHMDTAIHNLIHERGVQQKRIVEIGCGKGLFLKKLVEKPEYGNTGIGFDPSYVGPASDLDGRVRFEKCFYGPDVSNVPTDIVICRHVIEHVSKPVDLLQTIWKALANSPGARLFFETPTVHWILEHEVAFDFFYEHCSYFTAESLTTAFNAAGFQVERVEHVFGGQYLWLEAVVPNSAPSVYKNAQDVPLLARQFGIAEAKRRDTWMEKIGDLARKERIALWGAGAKGVTFANLIDPGCETLCCVVDLNPQKQGGYLPGTGHPIVSCSDLAKYGVTVAVLMNPNYREENCLLLQQLGSDVKLIDA